MNKHNQGLLLEYGPLWALLLFVGGGGVIYVGFWLDMNIYTENNNDETVNPLEFPRSLGVFGLIIASLGIPMFIYWGSNWKDDDELSSIK